MNSICLIVVFNHRYDQNIEKIKKIYQNRFQDIYILMPFYDGPSVEGVCMIPVYESSYQFQGYIAMAYQKIVETGKQYQHYVIIGDDLILNPCLDENSILDYLNLQPGNSYMKAVTPLNMSNGIFGRRLRDGVIKPFARYEGVEWKDEIMSKEDAFKIYEEKMGGTYPKKMTISWLYGQLQNFFKNYNHNLNTLYHILCVIESICINRGFYLPYPLLKDYSDFLVINGDDMNRVCHMFGVFAAMGVFVEVAIPTAMMLECSSLKVEKDIDKRGIEYWNDDTTKLPEQYDYSLEKLFKNWDEKVIYYHPVKLSKWK